MNNAVPQFAGQVSGYGPIKMPVILANVDSDSFSFIKNRMDTWKFKVTNVISNNQLLDTVENLNPSLIVMDTTYPFVATLNTLLKIRQSESGSRVPIVLFSGFTDEMYRKQALGAGANGFIVKPLNMDSLEIYFKSLISVYERHRCEGGVN